MALTPAAAATQPPSNDVTKEVTVQRRRQLPLVQNFVITPVVTRDHQPGVTQPRNSRADLWCRPQTINKPRERDIALMTLLECFPLQWYFSENSTQEKMENGNARQVFSVFHMVLMIKLRGVGPNENITNFKTFLTSMCLFRGTQGVKNGHKPWKHSHLIAELKYGENTWSVCGKEFTQTPKEEMQIHLYLQHKYPTFYCLCFLKVWVLSYSLRPCWENKTIRLAVQNKKAGNEWMSISGVRSVSVGTVLFGWERAHCWISVALKPSVKIYTYWCQTNVVSLVH